MQVMVIGFMHVSNHVLLVRKSKPEWQRGLWNGVGGKVETTETPIAGVVREFLEETKIPTQENDWSHFATEIGPGYVVHCYSTKHGRRLMNVPTHNDVGEQLDWFLPTNVLTVLPVVGNLKWMIPLSLDWRTTRHPVLFHTDNDIKERATW